MITPRTIINEAITKILDSQTNYDSCMDTMYYSYGVARFKEWEKEYYSNKSFYTPQYLDDFEKPESDRIHREHKAFVREFV